MGIETASCDDCGVALKRGEIFSDHDGSYRCERCDLKNKIREKEAEVKSKLNWLEATHFRYIRELKEEITELKEDLNNLTQIRKDVMVMFEDRSK